MSAKEYKDEDDALALKAKGTTFFSKKHFQAAIRTWTIAIDRYGKTCTPDTLRALRSNRSVGYFEWRKWIEAIEEARGLLRDFPNAPKTDDIALKAYLRIGRAHIFMARDKSALVALKLHKTLAQRRFEDELKTQEPTSPTSDQNSSGDSPAAAPKNRFFTKKDQARIDQLEQIVHEREEHERTNPSSKKQKTAKYEVRMCNGRVDDNWDPEDGLADHIRFVYFYSVPSAFCTKHVPPQLHGELTRLLATLVYRHDPEIRGSMRALERQSSSGASEQFVWTCIVCSKPATSIRHNPMSYLATDKEPGPWVLDNAYSVCKAGGPCDLEVERENRAFLSGHMGVPEGKLPFQKSR